MAGKGDIVEQALKLVMGGGDDAAKKAFANTRLKTPQGDPMRLYHMTPEDIFEFRASPENRSGPAVFLSPYPDFQPAYHQSAERGPAGELTSQFKEGANVMPVYADVRNPLVLDHPRKIKEAAAKYQGGDPNFPRIISPEARSAMEAEGYDGVVFGGDNPIPYGDRPMDARLGFQEGRGEEFLVFDPKRVKSAVSNTGEYDFTNPDITKAGGGEVNDDVDDALRIAKDVGGSTPVLMEDAKGNKYDAKGNIIPPQNPGPNPSRTDATPQSVAAKAVNDPATYDALMERYAVPDRDIAEYEALKATVGQQPQDIRQMTHVGDRPRREVAVDMPLFGGEYSMGTAPYDVASGMQGAAQTAYDLKTAPFYFNPFTAPIAAGMDLAEGIATNDPLTASLAVGFGPGGKYAKAAGIGAVNYFMDPAEAQAGPERWFSKLYRSAEALPMEKMTGEQALAMLRKTAPQEEIKWTGLEGFASENPVTTKKALLDFLKRNQVRTQDVVLGGSNKPTSIGDVQVGPEVRSLFKDRLDDLAARRSELDRIFDTAPTESPEFQQAKLMRGEYRNEANALQREMVDEEIKRMGGLARAPKYESYSTPGGKGYQETVITLGGKSKPQVVEKNRMWHLVGPDGETMRNQSGGPYTYYTENDAQRAASSLYRESGKYRSSHWDEPDVIGHLRSQMLTATPPGASRPMKLFNVDEAQSDWAQDARKRGFFDPAISAAWQKEYWANKEAVKNAKNALDDAVVRATRDLGPEPTSTFSNAFNEYYDRRFAVLNADPDVVAARKQLDAAIKREAEVKASEPKFGGVPAAPYVTSTQGWTDLSIKKSLDQAIDSGADYFTFTPGEVQAERYDLSKHISKVQYNPDDGSLLAYDPKGKMVVNESVYDPSDLDEYVGRELGDKIRAEASSREAAIDDAYELSRDEENDGWVVSLYGEPSYDRNGDPLVFGSRGEAKDYINELKANDYGNNPVSLSGLDLRTGGEGMIDYYNNIYKKRVEKVVKDLTGKKVQWEVLPAETSEGIVPRLGFRIDDDLREAKFPTFASGGVVNKALQLTRDY